MMNIEPRGSSSEHRSSHHRYSMQKGLKWCNLLPVFLVCAVLLAALMRSGSLDAQPAVIGPASHFTMSEYFDPPHETQMKSLITGAEAQPLPGGRFLIKELRLELFNESGKVETVVEAPECVYDVVNRTADSPGHLSMHSGDGRYSMQGEGFLWRQDAGSITISNKFHTEMLGGDQTAKRQ